MPGNEASAKVKIPIVCLLLLGIVTLVSSSFFLSSFFAMVGLCLVFWSSLLIFLIPTKTDFPLLLNAVAASTSANIESMITANKLTQKGIYLAPNFSKKRDFCATIRNAHVTDESTIVFLPEVPINENNQGRKPNAPASNSGICIIPPGEALFKVIEKQIGESFQKINIEQFAEVIHQAFTKLKLAQSVEVQITENTITIEVIKSHLTGVCNETSKYPNAHNQVGCLLSSVLACALANVTAKPVVIEKENVNSKTNCLEVQLRLLSNL